MQKVAEIDKKSQVRNLKFHVKIKDADLLGGAIDEIVAQRTSGRIDPFGRGFKTPDPNDFIATVYSSTMILADQPSFARDEKSEFIYTMDDVVFRTEIMVENKDNKFNEREVDITLNGGWVKQNGEYVLVIFTKKQTSKFTDYQKMQGRSFYNAVFTRYVTHAIGEDVLELRNFDVRMTNNDYPDIKDDFDINNQRVIDHLRGGKVSDEPDFNRVKKPKTDSGDKIPSFVKRNYFLYNKKDADITFGYRDPNAAPRPFNKATDAGIDFKFNFPNFVSDETVAAQDAAGNNLVYNAPTENPRPGDVEISFQNIPKNMPGDIFENIYDYLKDGLESKELQAGTNLTYGNTIFHMNPEKGEESLHTRNLKRIKALLAEIDQLYRDNREYKVDFDENIPEHRKATGVNKNILKYLNELEVYVKELKRNLPMSLFDLDELISKRGEYAVNPKNVNLLKILKTVQ